MIINIKSNAFGNCDEPLMMFLGCLALELARTLKATDGEPGCRHMRKLMRLIHPNMPRGPHADKLVQCARLIELDEWADSVVCEPV